eukprot:NODE_386_length_2318_cov_30.200529_g358_i0.p1 GENE.NODE_386_length_2318_cov_30.200529_g358_i0~~NODE_386_length_2318_cov_30.200529_g358_i0.p1  ORF type:complete len:200 (+),score=10.22 NODE_386_length_2318_cov_30.200529_g358_i0:70-669(+)
MSVIFLHSLGIGTLAGGIGSLVGMGGGFVSVPLLTSGIVRLSQHQAHGTSLCGVVATGTGGALSYANAGAMDINAAMCIASTGMLSARWGVQVMSMMPALALKRALGLFMLTVAPMVPAKPYIMQMVGSHNAKTEPIQGWARTMRLLGISLCLAFLAIFILPSLHIFCIRCGCSFRLPGWDVRCGWRSRHRPSRSALLA